MSRALITQAHAHALPLRDASVDLIVTSPPYFALRSYRDGGEHYAGQLGSEETPGAFVDALIEATAEMVRVLKPTGSMFVNLGDKYAGSGGHNNAGISDKSTLRGNGHHGGRGRDGDDNKVLATLRNAPDRYNQNSDGIRPKSLMGLPWRYANAAVDRLGLILRAELVWWKPNGLPESVTERVRRSHEQWFHFVKQDRYFSAVDEIREVYKGDRDDLSRRIKHPGDGKHDQRAAWENENPLGKIPGSVWTIPSVPLIVPDWARERYDLPDHFAAFPQEWPRRLILGWSPSGICVKCGEGLRPVSRREIVGHDLARSERAASDRVTATGGAISGGTKNSTLGADGWVTSITGYACACTPFTDHPADGKSAIPSGTLVAGLARQPTWSSFANGERGGRVGPWREHHLAGWNSPPTRPAVVLDPFGGTGTVAMVARALGRIGLNVDLSGDYCRLARWRIYESGHAAKTENRTWGERQGVLHMTTTRSHVERCPTCHGALGRPSNQIDPNAVIDPPPGPCPSPSRLGPQPMIADLPEMAGRVDHVIATEYVTQAPEPAA